MTGHFLNLLLERDAAAAELRVRGREGPPVATSVEGAFDSAARTRGLLGRPALARDAAMVIAPCSAIHTFKMQFAIDVIFTARDGRVLRIRRNIQPGRIATCLHAFAVVEMTAGEADRHGVKAGDYLEIARVISQ